MDKPKHKDGMLAAGKKRLEQFRQKKQGKGSSSKHNKPETDIEHGRQGADVEHVPSKGSKSMKCTSSDDLEATNNRSDFGSYEVPIDLKVARADDTASQINTEHSSTSDLDYGSAHSFNPEESALEQCREEVAIGNSEFCLRIDSFDSSGLHLSSIPGYFETPIGQESLVGGFDSGRVSVVPDLSISMADLVAPDINVNHDLVNNGDVTTELSRENIVMNSFCSDSTEAVEPYEKEQEFSSSLESGASGMPLCSSTNQSVSIAQTSSAHGNEKASELHNQGADFTGSNCSECATCPEVLSLQSTLRWDEQGRSGPNGAVPGLNATAVNLEYMGVTTEVMIKEQVLPINSDPEERTCHLTDSKSKSEVGFDTHVAGAAHLAVIRPEVDSPPVSEAPNGAHALESHIEDIIVVSGAVESSNKEQPRNEELNDTNLESGVRGMPLDLSSNQAEFGLNNDSGSKESSDDSYQNGMPVVEREDMTTTAGAEEPSVLEVSELSDDLVQSDSVALEHQNAFISLHAVELTANSLGIGEDATSVTLMVDRAGGELSLEHVSDEGLNSNIGLNNIPETNSERGSTSSGFQENIEPEASLTDGEITHLNTDKLNVSETAVQQEEGAKETVREEGMVNPIQESLFGDGLNCPRSLQMVEAEQTLGKDKIMNSIEGGNTGIMMVEEQCSVNPFKFEVNAENTSNVNLPEGIVTSNVVHNATADSLNTNEAHIPGSNYDSGFSGFVMDMDGESKARSGVKVNPLDSCLAIYGKTEEVQGGVEEVTTNEGSDSSMDEVAFQLRMDKAVKEFVPGQNVAEEVQGQNVAEEVSKPVMERSQELYRTEVSLESRIDEPDSVPGALAVDNGFPSAIEDNVGDGLLGGSYMQHEVDISRSLDAEISLGNTTEQRTDFVLSGSSLKHESDVPSPLLGDWPLESISRAVVHDREEGSDSNFTKPFHSSLDAEPTLDVNCAENQEHVLTSVQKFGDHVEVTGTDSERGQEPAEVSQFKPAVQSCSMSKVEIDSIISDSCRSYEVLSVVASPDDCAIELPLVLSPNNTCDEKTEHHSWNPLCQDLSSDFGIDVNQKGPVELPSTSVQEGHSLTGQESKGFDKSDLPLESVQEGHSVTGHESRGFGDLPSINEAGSRNETSVGVFQCVDDVGFEEQCWSNKIGLALSSRFKGDVKEEKESENVISELLAKAVEERVNLEGELKYFQELHAEKDSKASLLEDLLSIKDMDLERLSNKVAEFSQNYDLAMGEVAKSVEERVNLEVELKHFQKLHAEKESKVILLEDLLSSKDMDLERLSDKIADLSQNYDLAMGKSIEERVNLEGELKYFQELHAEKESKVSLLEDLLSSKDMDLERLSDKVAELSQNYDLAMGEVAKSVEERLSLAGEFNHLQRLYAEQEEEHLRMCTQANALADRISTLLSPSSIAIEAFHGDAFGTLELLVASLQGHYETVCRESKDLLQSASDADAAYEVGIKDLRALLSAKEAELAHVQEKVDFLSNEISKTKEDGEKKVQEAEQKVLGVRERLSLAVTKGKGLVQQRDNLKQLLAEKTAELETLSSSYSQELHVMKVALNEAESKVKLNSEAVERVEALESELSYIRNSANALRESFLQKDAVLQKIEELLEDANLPEKLQIKDIYEKVEWLLEAYIQQTSVSEGQDAPETVATRGMDNFSVVEQASQLQEIEQLNRKCDELLRKYRDMAEQSAMLEQSLLERNLLIQRWEEMLDDVDMPTAVRSKEPDEKIEWLGTAVSDAHTSIAHLQAETESLQTTVDTLNHTLQKLQEENSVLSVELTAKDDKLRTISLDLEDMTLKYNSFSRPTYESSDEIGMPLSQAGLQGLEESECKEEASQQQQFQIEDSEAFVANIRMLLSEVVQEDEVKKIFSGVPASTAFETSVKFLVENSKVCSAEVTDTRRSLAELTSAMSVADNDQDKELQILHEALSSRALELSNLTVQLEGLAAKNAFLEDEVDDLQEKIKVKSEELSCTRDELNKSKLDVSQGEDKLASVREKLSMAVKKGKSVVQQRDVLKQTLEEKTAEISQVRKEQEAENLALMKAKQSLRHQLQQVEMLEADLSSSRNYASSLEKSLQENNRAIQKFAEALDKIAISGAPRSGDLAEKIQGISQLVFDLQRKAGISEQEAKKSKKATELLALELEEVQGRMDSLGDELMHAEKNISLLIEEKKSAESSKAEAGLRLEHAMANINSLLFELSESRETQENLEQENNSLKDSLSAQMDEIRYKQTKAEDQLKELTDLYNKVHALKANQLNFLDKVADQAIKSSEDMRGTKALVIRIAGELKDRGLIPLPTAPAFVESSPLTWQPEMEKTNQGWKQGVTAGSLKLLCEEMEIELQHFDDFFKSFVMASNQDSIAMSQMLLGICDGLGPLSQMMQSLKRNADSTESLVLQKDEQIKVLGEVFKAVAEKVRSSVEEMKVFKEEAQGQVSQSGTSAPERMPSTSFENLQAHTVSLVEKLSWTAKDLACSRQQDRIQNEQQIEDLRNELRKAKAAIDVMDQQQQVDKLKISELQKCLEEFEVKEGILMRTNQELYSLHDVLSTRKQEEEHLVEALNRAETTIRELSSKVEELEKAKHELAVSLGKASTRFYTTVNNFNKFQSLSEKLIEEAESLHLLLEDRDAQISLLKEEVDLKGSEVTSLQNLVHEKTSDLSHLYQQIGGIVSRDAGGGESLSDLGLEIEPGSRKQLLEALATSVRAGTEGLRVQLARKDALLQDVQLRHDDLARKVTVLESSLLENQRLMEERGHANVAERMMISVEAEEKGNRGKHATTSVAVVTHGRGGRKVPAASDHLALDVDTESSRLLVDVDDEDKGHIFKPLTSSRLVPRGTRILVDRLDGFWVSGERLLRRRPGARLSVMLYWLVLHIWMVAILL